jgi:hypothetical protein
LLSKKKLSRRIVYFVLQDRFYLARNKSWSLKDGASLGHNRDAWKGGKEHRANREEHRGAEVEWRPGRDEREGVTI